jgi:hypothetical protein
MIVQKRQSGCSLSDLLWLIFFCINIGGAAGRRYCAAGSRAGGGGGGVAGGPLPLRQLQAEPVRQGSQHWGVPIGRPLSVRAAA